MKFKIYAISEYILSIEFDLKPSTDAVNRLQYIKNKLLSKISADVLETHVGLNSISLVLNPVSVLSISKLDQKIKEAVQSLGDDSISENTNSVLHQIPILYDGQDLPIISKTLGLSVAEIIDLHIKNQYVVGMIGFLPGFPYLLGLNSRLHLPRKTTPTTRLKTGSIAMADVFTGIYPQESPGGWNVIGHTHFNLFSQDALSTLKVGDKIKFEAL